MINELSKQVSDLQKHISFNVPIVGDSRSYLGEEDQSVDPNVSRELYEESQEVVDLPPEFVLGLETKLKEPAVPKAPESFLNVLKTMQHLDVDEWTEVRYADVQKIYNHTPGFVDLEANDEIKAYDSLQHLAYADKAYAALTFCAIKQKTVIEDTLKSFLLWAKNENNLNYEALREKLDVLVNGEYAKVSSDLLQLICGHRAEAIQMRRDGVTKNARDQFFKSKLRRIPPSFKHLFDQDKLAAAIEKEGGVKKAFLPPPYKYSNFGSTAQVGSKNKNVRHPSQGSAVKNQPSQGSGQMGPATCYAPYPANHYFAPPQGGFINYPPSQGVGYNHYNRPSQGQANTYNRPVFNRGTFRPRTGKFSNRNAESNARGRRRAGSPCTYIPSKKRRN